MASLKTYWKKRDFARTTEPAGRGRRATRDPSRKHLSFVVQRHDARALHYDFRLEHHGVLLSWAIPKGPSLDPKDRRLAVRTEDHPYEYGSFEGVIPKGHYGAGKVTIWDAGTWTPESDVDAGLRKGHLVFALEGTRLQGRFHLTRMHGRDGDRAKENWLLIKGKDEDADAQAAPHPSRTRTARPAWSKLKGRRAIDPTFCLATLVKTVPDGDEWIHETKFDGYRSMLHVDRGTCRVITRGGNDWTDRFPRIAKAAAALRAKSALIDGEIVAYDERGTSRFQLLQKVLSGDDATPLVFQAFDLLEHDGHDLRSLPLMERKAALAALLARVRDPLRSTETLDVAGPAAWAQACQLGLEGIISKRREAPYRGGRGFDWVKSKCMRRQEFVIGGFTEPQGSRTGFGALLVGVHEDGDLVYAGKVGTGFGGAPMRALTKQLKGLERDTAPFAVAPRERGARWVKPVLVCEVAFAEWTSDGKLRHASFQGSREDKPARAIVRERPKNAPRVARSKATTAAAAARKPRPARTTDLAETTQITNADKVLFPDAGVTKGDLARYLAAVAPAMLPYVADRPLAIVRCPDGISRECFYQKNTRAHDAIVVHDARELVALAQLGVIEIHPWGSTVRAIERPDVVIFDLDPSPGVAWKDVVATAHAIRARLRREGLASFAKLTGGKGVHVVAPTRGTRGWTEHKRWSKGIADEFVALAPDRFTTNARKSQRGGKIFIDYLRNGRGATAVAPYSPRARAGAPVAVPIAWAELTPKLAPDAFGFDAAIARARRKDPWAGYFAPRSKRLALARGNP